MPFSSGVFSLVAGNPVTTGTTISSTWANDTLDDIADNGLSLCLIKDGTQTPTANLPMGGFKLTGLGAGSALTDSATLRQVQYGFGSFLTSVAGTNTITGTATPTPAYTVGQRFTFIPAATNTGATTLNISSVGAGAVQLGGAALTGGELLIGTAVTVYVTAVTPVFEIISTPHARGTFTVSLTGCTAGVTGTAAYSVINNVVTLYLPILTGTSNTTDMTATGLPAQIQPATAHNAFPCLGLDNGSNLTAPARADIAVGTITFYTTFGAAAWTNVNGKGLPGGATFTYNLN